MSVNPCPIKVTSFDLSKSITFSKFFSKVKLSPTSKLVLRCLVDHWNAEKMFCYPSQDTIAEETGASLRSVKNAIQELRQAGLILTELKGSLNYTFTVKFFELVNIAPARGRKCTLPSAKIAPKQIKEKINNKTNSYNYKNNKVVDFQREGIKYKSAETTKKEIKKSMSNIGSPLDMNKEQAIEWLKNLPKILENSYFAKEIRKKWNL